MNFLPADSAEGSQMLSCLDIREETVMTYKTHVKVGMALPFNITYIYL
jgi:hypothetical protein